MFLLCINATRMKMAESTAIKSLALNNKFGFTQLVPQKMFTDCVIQENMKVCASYSSYYVPFFLNAYALS